MIGPKERLYLWSADNFRRQVRQTYPLLKPLCLTSKNECGIEKLTMTFIKPAILEYSHLFNLDESAKFISEYLFYEPKGINNFSNLLLGYFLIHMNIFLLRKIRLIFSHSTSDVTGF